MEQDGVEINGIGPSGFPLGMDMHFEQGLDPLNVVRNHFENLMQDSDEVREVLMRNGHYNDGDQDQDNDNNDNNNKGNDKHLSVNGHVDLNHDHNENENNDNDKNDK
mmetsp:Transcript_38539/g.34098  ORF Transcript_38539/g.34098 Transcript_38539/m.34098 type:complete len:107 (+) Transcript_38539:1-321(+)